MISKLALGTVQFGMDYGINNPAGRISYPNVLKILSEARSAGVQLLDSAFAYGESEPVLGKYFSEHKEHLFDVVTKMSPNQDPEEALGISLKRLELDRVYGYLLHDFTATKNGDYRYYEALRKEVVRGRAEKGGFSVYYPSDLEFAMAEGLEFELVQIPASVFDQRFFYLLPKLKERGVEIHVRSVFLQGLCFLPEAKLTGFFNPALDSVRKLRAMAEEHAMSVAALCLKFVLSMEGVSKVVIGVNGVEDLKENVQIAHGESLSKAVLAEVQKMRLESESILLPFNWEKER